MAVKLQYRIVFPTSAKRKNQVLIRIKITKLYH